MEITSILGVVAGVGFVLLGFTLDGGHIMTLVMPSAALIVLGGSFGALTFSYSLKSIKRFPILFAEMFKRPKSTINETIEFLIQLSQTAKQDGLFSLEKAVVTDDPKNKIDPFLKRGILTIVDGTDTEKINDLMQNEIYVYEQDRLQAISMFDTLAAFSPAFGLIGTLVGMVHMLSAGLGDPDSLTKAIAVAFTATLYGTLFANCFWTPAATKLKERLANYRLEKEMIIEAVCAIRNGVNPKMLREQLAAYEILGKKSKKKDESSQRSQD